jgi:hypothetical protein
VQAQLSTIAEVAIGLSGFASLATVLRDQEQTEALVAMQRLLVLLILSLAVVFLSLLPPLFAEFGFGEPMGWRLAASVTAIFVLFVLSPLSPLSRNLKRVRIAGFSRPQLYRDWSVYPTVASLGTCGCLALGLLPQEVKASAYVASLAMLLLSASVQFVRLMVSLVGWEA